MQSLWSAQQIQGGRPYQEDFFAVVENSTVHFLGKRRPIDQGCYMPPAQSLYLLSDGMGGMGHGDYAAAAVIDTFIQAFLTTEETAVQARLNSALMAANDRLRGIVTRDRRYDGMGCTVVGVVLDCSTKSLRWVSVGDSPLWLYRKEKLIRLNEKHTWAELLKKDPTAADQLDPPPEGNWMDALASAVDGHRLTYIDQPENAFPVEHGDLILIASDGVETLSVPQLEKKLAVCGRSIHLTRSVEVAYRILNQQRAALIDSVNAAAGPEQDNATVILGAVINP